MPVLLWRLSRERVVRCELEAILIVPVRDCRAGRETAFKEVRPWTVREPLKVEHAAKAAMSASDDATTWLPHISS